LNVAGPPDRRLPPSVFVDEEGDARVSAGRGPLPREGEGRGHRLLAEDRDAMLRREPDETGMAVHVGDDVDEVGRFFSIAPSGSS
jgi:hypothetical protein